MKLLRIALLFISFPLALMAENPMIRKVLAFWDSHKNMVVEDSLAHKTLEMPLNHLGLDVIYADIQQTPPDLSKMEKIRGIILCFQEGTKIKDPNGFIEWAIEAIDLGNKIIILGDPGFSANLEGVYTSGNLQNRLFEKMGFINAQKWIDFTFDYEILEQDAGLFPFEKDFPNPLPGFYINRAIKGRAKSLLSIAIEGKPDSYSDLAIISPNGAYISDNYYNNYASDFLNPRNVGWYVNPFKLFRMILDIPVFPIPDVTTLAGRRLFFTTCHGDSWNTLTSIEEYEGKEVYCSEVLLEKVFKPNSDLPMTVAVVAGDVDPKWVGKKLTPQIVRDYFNLPHIQSASHTYSHPFFWDFFETGGPEKEIDYLHLYPYGTWKNSYLSWFRSKAYQSVLPKNQLESELTWGYVTPRAYANEPFNLNKEITGAVDYLNQFAPQDNKIQILIWSGDSRPWSTPVELCEKAGIKQFGGGTVRFDPDFPSMLYVFPLGRKPGGLIQLYAASNGENSYTNGWKGPFFGYKYLPATLTNTESPRRLKPIQLYFHSYSGQFQASVDAILSNIDFIRTQRYIPITTSRFCDIGEGFYSAQIENLGSNTWKIQDRKGLQTVRFDDSPNLQVDLSKSSGVIGFLHHQNSLYVYLDAAELQPIIAIGQEISNGKPYLVDSSWEIWDLKRDTNEIGFKTKGWGKLLMTWKMPKSGRYSIETPIQTSSVQTEEGFLAIELDLPFNQEIEIKIIRES